MLEVYDLRTEYRSNPVGIDAGHPRLSWKLRSDKKNVVQESYRIVAKSHGETIWDSGIVHSEESQRVLYDGSELQSAQVVEWTVTVSAAGESAESQTARFEMALLASGDWKAKWIQPEESIDYEAYKPSARLRKVFEVREGLVKARIYQSAHGLYEFWINGTLGTEEKFKPGCTSYYTRLQYQVYDITDLLNPGKNVWAIELGDGWWRGNTGGGNQNNFGFYTAFIGQIILEYEDGTKDFIVSDEDFRTSEGARKRCDMEVGEIYDARENDDAWKEDGFNEDGWKKVLPATEYATVENLIPSRSVPVVEREQLEGKVFVDAQGNKVIDFGQNHAGYVKMRLRNTKPGQRVLLWHGEALKNGVFSTDNLEKTLDAPFQLVEYICKGAEVEEYVPLFAIFGYRYVKIEGYDSPVKQGDFVSKAVYSDMDETGTFSCSNLLLNRLISNSIWSQKSNFMDVPTDCPTRERSSWSGDSQVYCKTASKLMNVYPFFEKWMDDLNAEQFESGCVGNTFPATLTFHNAQARQRMIDQGKFIFSPPAMAGPKGESDLIDGAAGWGDTATITPYTMYLCYGDKKILAQQYESAKKWVEYCIGNAKKKNPLYEEKPPYRTVTDGVCDADYIYDTHFHWGEWLEPDAAENGGSQSFSPPEMAKEGNPLVATAYLFYSSKLLAKMADLLGKDEDEAKYAEYAKKVKRVYNKYFIKEDGTILEGRQAPYARTLAFGLADPSKEKLVAAKLAEAVERAGYTINTGFLSTPFLLEQLTRYGYKEHAFKLLEQTAFPSWLHSVTLGATTILESWSGMDSYSGSFNHYCYGAVSDFMISRIAGIRPTEAHAGYKKFVIEPLIGGTLTWASASYESIYGKIVSTWEKTEEQTSFHIEIPTNTSADVILPGGMDDYLRIKEEYPCRMEKNNLVFELGSGSYEFHMRM